MVGHADSAYVIDARGDSRVALDDDPGSQPVDVVVVLVPAGRRGHARHEFVRHRGRARLGVRRGDRGGTVALAAGVMAAPGAGAAPAPGLPLASGVTTPAMASVALPMGDLGHLENTFWELFLQPSAGTTWTLRTPPGVADNGGIAVAVSPAGAVTVGFLPSFLLRFSPLARSTDGGTSWSSGLLLRPAGGHARRPRRGAGRRPSPSSARAPRQRVLSGNGLSGWTTVTTDPQPGPRRRRAPCAGSPPWRQRRPAGSGARRPVRAARPHRRAGPLGRPAAVPAATAGATWSSIGPRLAGGRGRRP